jgi:putative endonuclease
MHSRGGGSAARYPARNERDESSETDDQHHTHHDNQDLERAHGDPPPFVTRAKAQGCDISSVAGLGPATHVLVATAPLFAKSGLMGGWVYILTNRRNGTLNVGTTVDLARRVWEHREGVADGFTKRHRLCRLVYAKHHTNILSAKQREMNIKHWPRAWKVHPIHQDNPDWDDLYDRLA